jgi:protein-disulfide isomerase
MSESGRNRRDKAAAARNAASSQEQRRERMVRIIGAITVVAVVAGIVGVAVVAKNSAGSSGATVTAQADPSAPAPAGTLPGTDAHAYGVPYGTNPDAPVLAIWEDFQCPACKAVEDANGTGIEKLAEEGLVQLVWRPTTFLDANLGNDSSLRAAAAWGCAVDAGKAKEFHNLVFANQPEREGTGYTDEQLGSFGEQAGITGTDLDTFNACVADGTYLAWAANSTQIFYDSGVSGTPSASLDGVDVPTATLIDEAALRALVTAAASPAAS